ncbi:MAG: fructose-bisphosphate aldolase [Thaumarchaeota archaeon]|nr:fructose-bisphosphate aldolase [Nitrososphaerota archaeon]
MITVISGGEYAVDKILRMAEIFRRGKKTFIAAMDHGLFIGPVAGIKDVQKTVQEMLAGGADAFFFTPGIAKIVANHIAGKAGLVMSIPDDETSVIEAVKAGAVGVKTTYFGPVPLSQEKNRQLTRVAHACDEWNMVYVIEVAPMDPETNRLIYDPDVVAMAARIGAEIGGDIVKTVYTGNCETFRQVVESCPVPIVILGGPKVESDLEVLKWVKGCVDAGGAGVAMGRNIWQHENPRAMAKAISKILHENASVEEAYKELSKASH